MTTTTSHTTSHAEIVAVLQREGELARSELARIDTKAAALMGWAGTGVAILAAAISMAALPLPATVAVIAGAALLAAAVAVLLCVIRPALPTPGRGYGFVRHAAGDGAALLATLTIGEPLTERLADEVARLSQLALTKYRRLRTAVDLLLAALTCLAAALPLGTIS